MSESDDAQLTRRFLACDMQVTKLQVASDDDHSAVRKGVSLLYNDECVSTTSMYKRSSREGEREIHIVKQRAAAKKAKALITINMQKVVEGEMRERGERWRVQADGHTHLKTPAHEFLEREIHTHSATESKLAKFSITATISSAVHSEQRSKKRERCDE